MVHDWALTRQAPEGDAILGVLDTHGGATCYTLERTPVAIIEGRYPIMLTVSERARRGELWAPGSDFRLPLLGHTNGRRGIRMHAGNGAGDSDGCILLGSEIQGVTLAHSRPAVIRIVNLLLEAEQAHDLVFLTVLSVKTPNWAKGTNGSV
jgi:hypothetical protein